MMTTAGVPGLAAGLLIAAVRGTKDTTLPMIRVSLSVNPEHNATPPNTNKAPRELTER
jgi:hypothetical protein